MSFGIYLPCIEFEAEAHVYGADRPAPLEIAALKFIHARTVENEKPTLDDLTQFLGVGRWIAYHILIGFWTRGWVLIFPESGRMQLSEKVSARLASGNLTGMDPAVQPARLKFIYDLVGGQVAPHLGDLTLREERRSDAYTYPKRRLADETPVEKRGLQRFDMPLDGYLNVSNSELQAALVTHRFYREHAREQGIDQIELKVLRPTHELTPGKVRYYSIYFDVYKIGTGDLRLEVNDERPYQRTLGKKLESAIISALEDGPLLEASLTQEARSRDTLTKLVSRPFPAFADSVRLLSTTETRQLQPRTLQDLIDSWGSARMHVLELVSRRVDIATSAALLSRSQVQDHLRGDLAEAQGQVVLSSTLAAINVLDKASNGGPRSVTESLAQVAAGPNSRLFLATTTEILPDIRAQFAQLKKDKHCLVRIMHNRGPHIGASFAIFGVDRLLLSSEPMLADIDQTALKLTFAACPERARADPLRDLFDRIARDLELNDPRAPELVRMRSAGPIPKMSAELQAIIDDIDALMRERVSSLNAGYEFDDDLQFEKFDRRKEVVWLEGLASLTHDLESWVLRRTDAAEVLVDAEIHDAAISLLERVPKGETVVVGISHATDLSRNLQMRDAIARRTSTCSGKLYLCLPADSNLDAEVQELEAEFRSNERVVVSRGREGSRWGFGFVLTSAACIIATRGIGQRIQNIGRARRGTEVGVQLFGEDLRDLALQIVREIHPLNEASEVLQLAGEWRCATKPGILKLYSAWFAQDAPEDDGNRGVTIVEPLLAEHPDMPWLPGSTELQVFPEPCRYALLKSAARLALDPATTAPEHNGFIDAPSLLALDHWSKGEILQAAILADWNPDLPIFSQTLREMTVAAAFGCLYTGNPAELFDQGQDPAQRRTFLMLAALLMLDGHGGNLSTFLNTHEGTEWAIYPDGTPLADLVAALARRDAENPGLAFKSASVADLGDKPDTQEIWHSAAEYVSQRRRLPAPAVPVRKMRVVLFKTQGSLMGDLSVFFADEAPNIKNEGEKIARLREIESKYRVRLSDFGEHQTKSYFLEVHEKEVIGADLNPILNKLQNREVESIAKLVRFSAALLSAYEFDSPGAQLDRTVAKLCSAVCGQLAALSSTAADPLSRRLTRRLEAGHPLTELATPVHVLPTAGDAWSPPDWVRLQAAYFEAELGPGNDNVPGGSTMPLLQFLDIRTTLPALAAAEREGSRWLQTWDLLSVIDGFGEKVAQAHSLHHAIKKFEQLMRDQVDIIETQARTLHLLKTRNALGSSEFEAARITLRQVLGELKKSLLPTEEKPARQCSAILDRADALLRKMRTHYGHAFKLECASLEAKAGAMDLEQRLQVQDLLAAEQLGAARWLLENCDFNLPDNPWVPESMPDVPALFQNCLLQSRLGPPDEASLRAKDVSDDCLPLFSALLKILYPVRGLPSAMEMRDALFAYFGADASGEDHVVETEDAWWITTSKPKMIGLLPYLATDEGEAAHGIDIVIPKNKDGRRRIEASRRLPNGWRNAVFGSGVANAFALSLAANGNRGASAERFDQFTTLISTDDAIEPERPKDGHRMLMIDAFPSSAVAPLPTLTHRQLVGLMRAPADQRWRACVRATMNLVGARELASWWHRDASSGDQARKQSLALIHDRSFAELREQAGDENGLIGVLAKTAELLGVRFASGKQAREMANWCNLRVLAYYSGGDLLNAHDLLFDCLHQQKRRRYIDLRAALSDSYVNRFQCRSLPQQLRRKGIEQSKELAQFLEYIELASFEDDKPGFIREDFISQAQEAFPECAQLFDFMVETKLITPIAGSAGSQRFYLKRVPWLFME